MFLGDHHTHSSCSPDGSVPMTALARGAVEAGVTSLCVTDHCDFLSLDGVRQPTYDWQPPLEQFHQMQQGWETQLSLSLGLEFGVSFLDPAAAVAVCAQEELDFVIGSVHNLSEAAGGRDFYCLDYETEADCYRALDDYFVSMERLAASPFYDVLGHIIYPLRYMRGHYAAPIDVGRYTDAMRRIFRLAIESGRGIEVNTWKGQTLREWIPVLSLYRACGGEILTVGSDAHAPAPIGTGILAAYTMLKDLGFRYVANYQKRKPEFYAL